MSGADLGVPPIPAHLALPFLGCREGRSPVFGPAGTGSVAPGRDPEIGPDPENLQAGTPTPEALSPTESTEYHKRLLACTQLRRSSPCPKKWAAGNNYCMVATPCNCLASGDRLQACSLPRRRSTEPARIYILFFPPHFIHHKRTLPCYQLVRLPSVEP